MLKENRSPSGRRRQKHAPGFRFAPPCHGFCASAVRRSGSLPVWRAVFTKGCLYGRQPSATHFCPPPAVPPGLAFMILPSAGAPGQTKAEGAASCGSVWAKRPNSHPSGQGGMAGGGGVSLLINDPIKRVSVRDSCLVARVLRRIRLREHQRQYPDQPLYYLASVQVDR